MRSLLPLLLFAVLLGAGIALVAYVAGDSSGAVELKRNVRGDVDAATQELIDLIKSNVR